MGDKSCRVKSVIQTEQHRASSGKLRLSWWPQFIADLWGSLTKAIFPGCNLNMWTSSGDEVYLRHRDDNWKIKTSSSRLKTAFKRRVRICLLELDDRTADAYVTVKKPLSAAPPGVGCQCQKTSSINPYQGYRWSRWLHSGQVISCTIHTYAQFRINLIN